ncbi:hypothetical protein [Marinoscillum pacificum]|uniref:hypothetical protein n=1 Tax=Marinoscillum pacificum TaxID=392723 RepID=UPI0021575E0F|nr:hypothetical protein [Marinoscillum pacificum]
MTRYLTYAFVGIVFIFLIYRKMGPVAELRRLEKSKLLDSLSQDFYPMATSDLAREFAFKKELLDQTQSDSIGLVINLNDSTVSINIHGVTLHSTKMSALAVDSWLTRLPDALYLHQYATSTSIGSVRSTIVKEPIVVRDAPKDPEEAAVNAYEPDTLIQNPAYLQFVLESNLQLIIEQDSGNTWLETTTRYKFFSAMYWHEFKTDLKGFLTFSQPSYTPSVRVKLPVSDMRSIYRALPARPVVVVNWSE